MLNRRWAALCGACLVGISLFACASQATQAPAVAADLDIPYTRFVLGNGLTVLVHEDHKAPIVAVNVWYHVGSKNEPEGKHGFAHLYEHLMFTGTQHAPQGFDELLAGIGATDNNGTTNEDRTDYFENVPANALDTALWMESERMGFLLPAMDQKKLEAQRGVVENEKRQDENVPYGLVEEHIAEATYPAAHPYHHTTIGSVPDLDAAKLDDVKEWFKTYYGPNNAVLVVAGDVNTGEVKQKVESYFGNIPATPPIAHFKEWVAKRSGVQRETLQDRVPTGRVYMVWNVPGDVDRDSDYMDMLADVLAKGKASRLYQRLVYTDQLASSVQAYVDDREIGSQFDIVATALPGKSLDAIEADINDELHRLLRDGPTGDETERVKSSEYADFTRGVERIGGFGGVSDVLAEGEVFEGNGAAYKESLKRLLNVTPDQLKIQANRWLADGVYILDVLPYGDFTASGEDKARAQVPEPGAFPQVRFPAEQLATLGNGLKLVVVPRHGVPLVTVSLQFDAGYAADQSARPGTAKLAMAALTAGTTHRTALQISEEQERLGASLGAGSALDRTSVTLEALKRNLDASLALFADVVLNPTFPDSDVAKLRNQQLAAISHERLSPVSMALRVFPKLLYGADNAYGLPLTGSGYEKDVTQLGSADLKRFHDSWFKPNNATLVVVGDTSLEEIRPKIEQLLGGWQAGEVPGKNLAAVKLPAAAGVYLVDRPGSEQSIIFAGNVAPPHNAPDNIALETMNTILGGDFTARINMNLREDKHWAYGAYSFLVSARGQQPFIVYAPVQTDKTAPSMAELQRELSGIVTDRLPTAEELERAKSLRTRTLPGEWETNGGVEGAVTEQVTFGLPADYWDTYSGKVQTLELKDVSQAAREAVHPQQLTWVVVGDLSKIEAEVRKLNLGPVHYIDADGNPVPGK